MGVMTPKLNHLSRNDWLLNTGDHSYFAAVPETTVRRHNSWRRRTMLWAHMAGVVTKILDVVDRFIPDHVATADAETRRRFRLVVFFSLALVVWGPVYTGTYFALGMTYTTIVVGVASIAVGVTPLLVRSGRSLAFSGHWVTGWLAIALGMVCFFSGGLQSGATVWFAAVPVVSVMLVGTWGGILWAGFSATIVLALTVAGAFGFVFPNEVPAEYFTAVVAVCYVGVIVLMASLAGLFESAQVRMLGELNVAHSETEAAHTAARLVLDNVAQGFLSVDPSGRIGTERSGIVETWFGAPDAEATLWEYFVGATDEHGKATTSDWMELGWEVLVEGVMPLEFAVYQLPKRTVVNGRHFRIEYQPVLRGNEIDQVLVVITDMTADIEAELAQKKQQELLAIVGRIAADRRGFEEFFSEASSLVADIVGGKHESEVQTRLLHTLKGNCGLFGIQTVVKLTHDLETVLAEEGRDLTEFERSLLNQQWTATATNIRGLLGAERERTIQVGLEEYRRVLTAAKTLAPHRRIIAQLEAWALDPLDRRLAGIAGQAKLMAKRLGKGDIEVNFDGAGLRLDPARWAPFWSTFVHVIRNTIDHGLESSRVEVGKEGSGTISLGGKIEGDEFVIEVADDGRGIDWDTVRSKAEQLGYPSESKEDLERALFADGLSTRDEVSEVSGRGVGMAALREVTIELGGKIEIASELGKGASFKFIFPAQTMTTPAATEDKAA